MWAETCLSAATAATRGIGPKLGRWVNRMNTYMGQKSNERGLELDVNFSMTEVF